MKINISEQNYCNDCTALEWTDKNPFCSVLKTILNWLPGDRRSPHCKVLRDSECLPLIKKLEIK